MSTITASRTDNPLTAGQLPRYAPWALGAVALIAGGVTDALVLAPFDIATTVFFGAVLFLPLNYLAGRLVGVVYDPDGIPVPGAKVAISFSSDYEITADESGWFDTQLKLPAGYYNVVARSTNGPSDGLVGRIDLRIVGGVTNMTTVQLLGRGDARDDDAPTRCLELHCTSPSGDGRAAPCCC